jgi:hypothetical protein
MTWSEMRECLTHEMQLRQGRGVVSAAWGVCLDASPRKMALACDGRVSAYVQTPVWAGLTCSIIRMSPVLLATGGVFYTPQPEGVRLTSAARLGPVGVLRAIHAAPPQRQTIQLRTLDRWRSRKHDEQDATHGH